MEKYAVLFVLAFANCVFCYDNAPLLLWNNHNSDALNVLSKSTFEAVSAQDLWRSYFAVEKPNNVLLFLQDKLSVEDLSSHSSDYENLNSLLQQSQHSLYLPKVEQPQQLIQLLVQQGYKLSKVSAESAVSGLKLDSTSKNLVLMKLLPTGEAGDARSSSLAKNDDVIQSVISKIGDKADFTIIYTGSENSVVERDVIPAANDDDLVRVARSVEVLSKVDNNTDAAFYNGSCILLYLRNNMAITINGKTVDVPIETLKGNGVMYNCTMGDTRQAIQLSYGNLTVDVDNQYSGFKIAFVFEKKGFYWRSPKAQVTLIKHGDNTNSTHDLQLVTWSDDYISIGKSYACSVPLNYKEQTDNTSIPIKLTVKGVQVQAFIGEGKNTMFGPSWDCVGFFTIGIWSALLAILLAVTILGVGFLFLADIQTMDRFDDPKGKTIVVAQAAD